ncbi:MAG: hypothetical protein Q8R36_04525 [bacterium]|nr:hypothetical protein [bacterium]
MSPFGSSFRTILGTAGVSAVQTFPTVAATAVESFVSGLGANPSVDLPAGIVANDLIILFGSTGNDGEFSGVPSGFTLLFDTGVAGGLDFRGWYKVAAGGETAVTVNRTVDRHCSFISYRISGYQGTPEAAVATPSKDPPNLSPSWGSAKTLWLAGVGDENDDPATAGPTGFSGFLQTGTGGAANGNQTATASKQEEVASQNPGAFTIPATESIWAAATVAIRPA